MSGYTRRSLGHRLATALDERAARGDLERSTDVDQLGRLDYIVAPGRAWAEPRPAALRMTPGETADWLGLDLGPAERIAEHTGLETQ